MAVYTQPNSYIFSSSSGRAMNSDMLRRTLQDALRKLGIAFDQDRADGLHLLRHTSGSLVYRRTANVKVTQAWLGHRSSRVTLDTT
jgi:integrase